MGSPKIPEPKDPPAAPPPPAPVAEEVETPALKGRKRSRKRGLSSLTIRRPSVNTGASGAGVNLSI